MRWVVFSLSLVFSIVGLELGLRLISKPAPPLLAPGHIFCEDCSYVYSLNPVGEGIHPLGIRAFEESSRPRILILGDSVTFGPGVEARDLYSAHLQTRMPNYQVINAGISGYSAYNEIEFYKSHGKEIDPEIIVIQFCMNDIVKPLLHWSTQPGMTIDVPEAAIPNLAYHHQEALPKFRLSYNLQKWSERSRLAELAVRALMPRYERRFGRQSHTTRKIRGKAWPVYLTLEDNQSIEILEDRTTPEWMWLATRYRELRDLVHAQGKRLIVLVLPLAYQLEPGYPFHPEMAWADFCAEEGLECVDMLSSWKEENAASLYLLDRGVYKDVWHLSEQGHREVAESLALAIDLPVGSSDGSGASSSGESPHPRSLSRGPAEP